MPAWCYMKKLMHVNQQLQSIIERLRRELCLHVRSGSQNLSKQLTTIRRLDALRMIWQKSHLLYIREKDVEWILLKRVQNQKRMKQTYQTRKEGRQTQTQWKRQLCASRIVYIRCMISYELWNENMSEEDFRFFTGLSKFNFEALYLLLDGKNGLMRLKYLYDMTTPKKIPTTPPKLSPKSRLLLMLVRMRRGTPLRDLAYQFGISKAWAGFIFFAVLRKVAKTFKSLEGAMFVTREQQQENRPAAFKAFPDVRIIIDGVEFRTQTPSNAQQQNNTFSKYKHSNTFKYVVGISCYGALMFVSEGFEGSKSDKDIMIQSGLLELLEPGDAVMCDRGFNVASDLIKLGVKTVKPPSMKGVTAMTAQKQLYNSAISQSRIYVEHAIGKIKDFRLLRFTIPLSMRGVMDDLVLVAAYLSNFANRAIKSRTKKRRSKYDD
ncbi:uncharacterized protein LOC117643703 [Thrips palmi]|uniref:Uncharacterized protein LOC117643703 n=1 Tax=Thrips palmi TaxID=161013 RepID=A0A6P8YP45_THRPL|nr:uncharacterized protein LOC117643703 [Thrips palmi]